MFLRSMLAQWLKNCLDYYCLNPNLRSRPVQCFLSYPHCSNRVHSTGRICHWEDRDSSHQSRLHHSTRRLRLWKISFLRDKIISDKLALFIDFCHSPNVKFRSVFSDSIILSSIISKKGKTEDICIANSSFFYIYIRILTCFHPSHSSHWSPVRTYQYTCRRRDCELIN